VGDPAEMLAMLAEHGVDLQHVPGGWPDLVALDVAGALGMDHDPMSADLLMAKYSANAKSYSSARIWWRMHVGDESLKQGWPRGKPGTTFAMADFTLDEWIAPQRCRSCKGVAQLVVGQKVRTCASCAGTGLRPVSGRSEARGLLLSESGYRVGGWSERVTWCRKRLQRIETYALGRLARRLTTTQNRPHNSHHP
jgi:hypothetical protein